MFVTQINSIEAQIEELTAKRDQYRSLENELAVAMEAIARIKQTALALDPEIADEVVQELSRSIGGVTVPVQDVMDKLSISESLVENLQPVEEKPEAIEETTNRYESAAEIALALADTENLDTHLMAIASILDECNAQEVAGRVWFFVQNVPGEFDSRILGYLPKSIRPEWDKQRTTQFVEARESILPPTSKTLVVGVSDLVETPTGLVGHITDVVYNAKEGGRIATVALPNNSAGEFDVHSLRYIGKYQAPAPEFKVGDWVELYTGEVCKVSQVKDFDGKIYVEVVNGEGKKEAYRNSDLKPAQAPVEVKGEVAAPVAAATAKKTRKPKVKAGSVESAPQPVEQTIETIEPDDLVQLPRGEVVPVLNVTYLGGSAQVSVKLPNGMEASFPASQVKEMPGFA